MQHLEDQPKPTRWLIGSVEMMDVSIELLLHEDKYVVRSEGQSLSISGDWHVEDLDNPWPEYHRFDTLNEAVVAARRALGIH